MISLLGEFGIVDVLVFLSYLEQRQSNKQLKKLANLQIYSLLLADENLDEILKEIREWKNMSKMRK